MTDRIYGRSTETILQRGDNFGRRAGVEVCLATGRTPGRTDFGASRSDVNTVRPQLKITAVYPAKTATQNQTALDYGREYRSDGRADPFIQGDLHNDTPSGYTTVG